MSRRTGWVLVMFLQHRKAWITYSELCRVLRIWSRRRLAIFSSSRVIRSSGISILSEELYLAGAWFKSHLKKDLRKTR